MRKFKYLLITIILILILFPTCVEAVSEGEVATAINNFVGAMQKWNIRYCDAGETNIVDLAYEGNYKYDNSVGFSQASFVDYVYKNAFGIDMLDGDRLIEYTAMMDLDKKVPNYFTRAKDMNGSRGEYGDLNSYLNAGKINVGDVIWAGGNNYYLIYLGNKNFARLTGNSNHKGNILIGTLSELKVTEGRVFHLNYNKITTINYSPDTPQKTSIAKEFDELGITAEIVKSTDEKWTVKLNKSKGEIIEAISRGFRSETGMPNPFYGILGYNGNKVTFSVTYKCGSSYYNIKKDNIGEYEYRFSSEDDTGRTLSNMNKILIEDYKEENDLTNGGTISDFYQYFQSEDRSLYLTLEWEYGNDLEYKFIRNIPISNGKEDAGEIDAFTSGIIADAKLSVFTAEELNIPEDAKKMIYELNFNSSSLPETETIAKENGEYKLNSRGEIVFTVDKDGYYTFTNDSTYLLGIYKGIYNPESIEFASYGLVSDALPIRRAGKIIEGEYSWSGYPVGEYLEPIVNDTGMAFPLRAHSIYILYINDVLVNNVTSNYNFYDVNLIKLPQAGEQLVELLDENSEESARLESQNDRNVVTAVIPAPKPETIFEKLEHLIAFCIRGIANGIVYMINATLGFINGNEYTVTMDSIIFNEYEPVQLSFFEKDAGNGFAALFKDNITKWYNNFMEIAIAGYLIVLLYMGIRIVLNSTAGKKAMYKELFTQWITGVIVLFTFPLVIKYAIRVNNAIVKVAYDNVPASLSSTGSGGSLNFGATTKKPDITPDETSTIRDDTTESEEAKAMEENPFEDGDQGYMAVMSNRAHRTKKIVYAIVYLIMAFQLLILAIMYYKRLFMVAFLIVLFPIVMLMFVLEKVANIRTGAFGKWTREILIAIFIQSIHAVIYSFTMTAVAKAGSSDWFLVLVGVTFLFNGEEILKKILGQHSEAVPSLAQTAATSAAAFMAVKAGTERLTDNVIGAGSHLGQAIHNIKEAKRDKKIAKNMKTVGTPPPKLSEASIEKYKELGHYQKAYELASAEGEDSVAESNEVAKSVYILNHRYDADPKQVADALEVLTTAVKSGKHTELLKDSNLSANQIVAMERAKNNAIKGAIEGRKTIQELDFAFTAELEQILPNENPNVMAYALYSQMNKALTKSPNDIGGAPGMFGATRSVNKNEILEEIREARDRRNEIRGQIKIASKKTDVDDGLEAKAASMIGRIYGYDKRISGDKLKMALSVSMLKDAASGKYDAKDLMTSANYILANGDKDKELRRMASELGFDINEYRHVLAEKICEEGFGTTEFREKMNNIDEIKINVNSDGLSENETKNSKKRMAEACELAIEALDDYEKDGVSYDTSLGVDGNIEGYALDKVDVSRVMHFDRVTKNTTEEQKAHLQGNLADEIQVDRQKRNTEEARIKLDFAKKGMELHKNVVEKTYQGMTKDEWMKKRKYDLSRARKETARTILTVGTSIEGGILGSAAAIGIGEDSSIIKEAAGGIFGGAVAGDAVAEAALSEGMVKKKIKKINPYTGEEVEVEITTWGGFSNGELESTTSDVGAMLSKKLDEQFLMQKAEKSRAYEENRRSASEAAAKRERLTEAYRNAIDEAERKLDDET